MTPEIKKALDLALDRAVPSILSPGWVMIPDKDFDAIKQALAAPTVQPVAFEVGLVEWVGNKLMAIPKTTTTPPAAQRQWVGLTEGEIEDIWYHAETGGGLLLRFAQAIEAKLKEKNG